MATGLALNDEGLVAVGVDRLGAMEGEAAVWASRLNRRTNSSSTVSATEMTLSASRRRS